LRYRNYFRYQARSLLRYSGSIRCSIHSGLIRASKNSAKRNQSEHARAGAARVGGNAAMGSWRECGSTNDQQLGCKLRAFLVFLGIQSEAGHEMMNSRNFFGELKRCNVYKPPVGETDVLNRNALV